MRAARCTRAAARIAGVLAVLAAAGARADADLDVEGTWYCLVYGYELYDDVYLSLRFDGTGRGEATWGLAQGNRRWRPLSNLRIRRGQLAFEDPATGNGFEADLSRATLGGVWHSARRSGGWWCADAGGLLAGESEALRHSVAVAVPLASTQLRAPRYPKQAIREAKEGRAVACFFVDREGHIHSPELVELSDEVFRAPTLAALEASRFETADTAMPMRPGCRSYFYQLDRG